MPDWWLDRFTGSAKFSVTTDYTATAVDSVISADASSSSPLIVTLPPAPTSRSIEITVANIGASGTVTVDASGSETIEGALTYNMTSQWDAVTLESVSGGWIIGGGGGGGGGASALDDLTDVDVSTYTPRAGQSLVFDGTTWENDYAPLLFVTYLWPVGVTPFTTLFGARPGDAGGLAAVGIDGTWWFHDEPNAADNGIWISTASPGTATQFVPQPGGIGSSIYTYQRFDGAGFSTSYLFWINTAGGDATGIANWTASPTAATSVLFDKTVPADWDASGSGDLQAALDELAARVRILEP